jgi:predicted nucleic acid-binding protein
LAGYFFDSSALSKFYHVELGSAEVESIIQSKENEIRISRLTVVELASAFAIKVRTKVLTQEDAQLLTRQFRHDLVSGRFEVFAIGDAEFRVAEFLIHRHAFHERLRTLDALQLAVGLALRDENLLDYFVSADQSLGRVATLESLQILNPEAMGHDKIPDAESNPN